MDELHGRQVDRHATGMHPACRVLAGLAQYPFAEKQNGGVALGEGNELARRNAAPGRVLPAQQRFVATDAPGRDIDLLLVVHLQLVMLDGGAQLAGQ